MRKLLFIFFLLVTNISYSQNYVEVYRYGLLGVMNLEQEHPDSAEKYLRKALELMPDKSIFSHYFNLIKIAHSHGDKAKIQEYLTGLSCMYPKDTIYKFVNEYSEISMTLSEFNQLYRPECELKEEKKYYTAHPKAVDSIIALIRDGDQSIRRKAHDKNLTDEEFRIVQKEMKRIDSTNFILLSDCIRNFGMPRLDYPLQGSRITQITHIDNYDNFMKIDKQLVSAIYKGCLNPANYAYAMDRSLVASGLPPKYYWFIQGSDEEVKFKPAKEELQKVNAARQAIGLPPYPQWTGWGFL